MLLGFSTSPGSADENVIKLLCFLTVLLQSMLSNNMEGILEATRVYGNLSQYEDVQDFILEQNGELQCHVYYYYCI